MNARPAITNAQQTCCNQSALDSETSFCTTCGKPLIRCMASAECGSLLDDTGLCPVCVQPEIFLDAGAAVAVREGGRLSMPLMIANGSSVKRPLFINGLWVKESEGDLRKITLPFRRLDSGRSADVGIQSGVLDHAGVHRIDLRIAVSTRYEWREENYVFAGAIIFPVESRDPSGPVTNITVQADQVGAGMTIYNPTRIESERESGEAGLTAPIALKVTRADETERALGLRGYGNGVAVPRDVEFEWRGFPEGHAPFDGLNVKASGLYNFGRGASVRNNGTTDVRLLFDNESAKGRENSLAISRQHFSLYIESGRLMLHVDSQFGLRVSNDAYGRTKTVILNDGDTIEPITKKPQEFFITISFEVQHDFVRKVVLTRSVRT